MPEPTFAEQITALNAALQAIEKRMSQGEIPSVALTEFKSSVDDLRLRLWGLLTAGSANDYKAFQESFRLRRAREICRGLDTDLRAGSMSPRHDELPPLGAAAGDLAHSIAGLRTGAS